MANSSESRRDTRIKPTPVDTEMESLGLSSVPGFERPMSSGPKDRWVGEDELGNSIYETVTGQRYTIRLNPDQRTTRTKVEEGVKSWNERGRPLPSREQLVDVAKQVPKAVYESMAGSVRGEGTIGDVVGMAPVMGAASAPFNVPDGSLRLFGGRKATNPGLDSQGNPLPQSLGKDGKPRFEIVDKDSVFNWFNAKIISSPSEIRSIKDFSYSDSLPNWSRPYSFLEEVFIHDELYGQYPQLRNLRIVYDDKLTKESTLGYFDHRYNLIALNPKLSPEEARSTLLHEIQHKIQEIEGFSRGTSVMSKEVEPVANTIHALKLNQHELDKAAYPEKLKAYEKAKEDHSLKLKDFENFDYRDLAHIQLGFLSDVAEDLGLPFDEFFTTPIDSVSILNNRELWTTLYQRDRMLSFIEEWGITQKNKYSTPSIDLSQYSSTLDLDKYGKTWFGEEGWEKFKDRNSIFGLFPKEPTPPTKPRDPALFPPSPDPDYASYFKAYESKAGEVESRNVSKRKDMTLEERFANPPESTEGIPRDEQWLEQKFFAKGGEVKKDPVSGNDIPPGGTAKGVRDDVPALLSEGEYVIPENVVSALGPKTFDKLVKEMNDMLKTQPGNVQKMAEGGFVENPTEADIISTFNPDNYRTVGFSYFGSPTTSSTQVSYTYVTYVNASGDTIQIRVDANGNPIDPVPAGYVPSSQAGTLQPREEGDTTQDQPDDFTSYYTYDEEQFQQMLEDPSGLEKAMMDLLGGGVFGSLIEQDRITNLEAAAVIANDLGYTDTAQELLEKSQALAAEAGEPSGMGKWLSADAANVVDRHRDAAPTGLLETLTLTPVEPGKPISLDGRTPPPEAFVPTTGTFTAPANPNQLPLGTDVVQLPPAAPPGTTTQGTTISPNEPSFGGVEVSTLPPATTSPATTTPVTDSYQGKSIVPADPRNAYSAWSQTDGLPQGYNQNPSIPQPAPFKQQTPDVAGFQPPAAGTVPTTYSTVDSSLAGRSAVGPSYPGYIPISTTTPGPKPILMPPPQAPTVQPAVAPTPTAPTAQTPVTPYYGSDPRLNTPVGSIPPAPTIIPSVAPTQPQVPTLVEQYIPGIDQGVTTKPTMPGELVTSPVPQAPSVGAAPSVNTQPPAPSVQQANPISNVYYYDPIQSVPPSVSDYVPNLSNTTVQSVSEKAFVQPTLETPTTVPVAGKTLGYPPTSGDNPPPPQQPPVPPGTTTANLAGAQVPAGTAGAVIPKDATAVSMTEEGLSSERVGLQVMSTPGKGNPAKVIGMDGKAYEVPVGSTVVIDGQTVSYNGGDKVTINGLEGIVGDIYPSTHFVNSSGQQPAPTQPTEPTVSQKNVTPTPKPAETSWISQTSLTLQEPDKVTQVSVDRYANNNADLVNAAKNAANQYGIPEELFLGLITQESQWNANAVSPAGAQGLTQVMPATATQPGYGVTPLQNWSVAEQLRFGAEYLNAMYQEFGNWEDALKAYNQGVGTTNSGTLTSEAAKYVPQVFQAADEWAKYEEEIKKYVPEEYASFDQTTGRTDYSNLDYGDLVSTGGDGDSGGTSSKTPTPTPTTTDLTTLSFGDTVTQPTGGGNVAPIEDYDSGGNQPFAKGGLVKRRAAKYSKGGLVKRRVMATRK